MAQCCLFDEAHYEMIQTPPSLAQMAPSKTNCHGYGLYMHVTLLMAASNTWPAELAASSPDDRAWLVANSSVLCLDWLLWVR